MVSAMSSCNSQIKKSNSLVIEIIDSNNTILDAYSVNIVTYQSCEYIVAGVGQYAIMSHKGNCHNKIHYQVLHDTVYIEVLEHSQIK